jgi:hypothetical protein
MTRLYRHPGGEEFLLTLRALGDDDAPPIVRLRTLLKYALRGLRLRCTDARETTPYPEGQPKRENATGAILDALETLPRSDKGELA